MANFNEEDQKLKKAMYETLKKYGNNQVIGALTGLLNNDDLMCFTNTNNSRTELAQIDVNDLKDTIINNVVHGALSHLADGKARDDFEILIGNAYVDYQNYPDALDRIKEDVKTILDLGNNSIANRSYQVSEMREKLIDSLAKNYFSNSYKELTERMHSDSYKISNVQTYPENITRAKSLIMSGMSFEQEGTGEIGQELFAATSIGRLRKNQQDAVLLVEHPLKPDFKMLVVADGVGGLNDGEYVSDKTVRELQEWFASVEPDYYACPEALNDRITQKIQEISAKIYSEKRGRAGSTVVCAIVGQDSTLVTNVGDSRAYALMGSELVQITKDDSVVQRLYEAGIIADKDDMRFHIDSNKITQCIGNESVRPSSYVLDNSRYDTLLLVTDGVTDCLSDERIKAISRFTDRRELAKELVEAAQVTTSEWKGIPSDEYHRIISAGKDNTTAATYVRPIRKLDQDLELESDKRGQREDPPVIPIYRNGEIYLERDE